MTRVAEIQNLADKEALASSITNLFTQYDQYRQGKIEEWKELRNYVFATDTKTTTNQKLGWSNSTTIPKLCQIRDNLAANYLSSLFSSDDWLRWEAGDPESADQEKAKIIEDYVKAKALESGLEQVIEQCLYDYIDTGNPFAEVGFVNDVNELEDENLVRYRGAKAYRISPYDMIFNPTAPSFKDTWKITRAVKSLGELKDDAKTRPDLEYMEDAVDKVDTYRESIGGYNIEDINKAEGYNADGFGSYSNYIQEGYVEILEFDGSIHDTQTGEFLRNYLITVIDRKYVLRKIKNPTWLLSNKSHVGWRERPDNIYGMGPLENLVGLQYRLDSMENNKADALDLSVFPPLKKVGEVEDFVYQPHEVIEIPDTDGDVVPMPPNPAAFQVNNEIAYLESTMELMAGSPRETMGFRTPGEKTLGEVTKLENAAMRIFFDKIRRFEKYFLEDILNNFLEVSRRNFDGVERIPSVDKDFGALQFKDITKEDITAKGRLRPIGSRHFDQERKFLQNIQGVFNSPLGEMIKPHINTSKLATHTSRFLGWDKYGIISDNAGISEKADQANLINELQDNVDINQATPNPLNGG